MRCLFPSLRRFLPLVRAQRAWLLALMVFSCDSFERLSAQSLSISNLNTATFPRISADIRAFDAAGNRITSAAGFTLQEDGVPRTLTVTSCPMVQPQTFSAVLTIDISGSMGQPRGQGLTQYFPLDIAKAAATAFIDALPINGTECALTAFETSSYIMSYYTQDRAYLKSAIDALRPLQGTNYQDAFLHPITGALAMAGRSTNQKRAIIFLTDGLSGANTDMVVAQALMLNVQVYCITIGLPAPQVLRDIVNRTGGRLFDNVTSREAAVQIYRELANTLSIDAPCRVEWTSEPTCAVSERRVTLTHNQVPNITATDRYTPQFSLASLVSVMPRGVAMGAVPIRTTQTRVITLTLNGGAQPVQVQNIRSSDPAFTIDRRSLTLPFTLQPAQAQQVSVIYTAADTSYHFTTFSVEIGNGCKLEFYGTAGFPGVRPANPVEPLVLIQPNGGEEFLVGTDTDIKWKGVPSDEAVKLEYSIDAGRSWRLVDSVATGLSYKWRVPNTPSIQCLMRVTQKNTSFAAFSNDSLIVLYQNKSRPELGTHNNSPSRRGAALSAQFDKTATGNEVVTTGSDGKAFLWNGWTGEASTRAFDLGVQSENGDVIDATYNSKGELGIIFFGSTGNTGIVPSQLPGIDIRDMLPQGRAPLSAIRFNPLIPNQFVITPSDPQLPISVYRFDNLGVVPGQSITKEYDIENSQGGIKIATFDNNGQWICAAYDRQVKLWDISQIGTFPVFTAITWDAPPGVLVLYVDIRQSASGLTIAATCSDNTIRFLSPSKTQTNKLDEISKFDAPGGMTLGKTTFDRNGQYLVSTAVFNSRGIALVWDVNNPAQPFPLLNGPHHGARVNSAFFSYDNPVTRVVTASEDGTAIIWFLREKLPLQRDESDRVWSIVRPVPQIFDVDMKRVVVGAAKDSVCVVLNNSTKYEIPIQQAFIATRPGQQSPFSVVSGNAPFSISTNGTVRMEFRFAPISVGTIIDTLVIITVSGDRLTALIRGEGLAPSITGINVNFGTVFVGGVPKDTTVTALITNIGQTTITLTDPTILGPRNVFQQGNGFPLFIELRQGQSAQVPLRFAPQFVGLAAGALRFTVLETGQITTATLTGTGIQEGALLQSTTLEASPSSAICDTTSFLVVLENKGNIDAVIPATGASIRAVSGGMVLNSPSSEFVILNPRTITIPAGSTTAIVVQFRPQRLGLAEAMLIVTSNSLDGRALEIKLKGTLERDSLVIPPSSRFLALASVEPNMMKDTTIVVHNAGNGARSVWFTTPIALGAANSRFTVAAVPPRASLLPSESSTLQFTFLGGEAGKTYNDFFIFPRTLCNIGSIIDTVRVSVTVRSRPELRFDTPSVNIVTCTSAGVVNVRVTNVGTAIATTVNISIRAPFSIDNIMQLNNIRPGDTTVLALRYNLPASGIFPDTMDITYTTGTITVATISLGLRIHRENVDFTISPRTIDFPRLEANMTASTTVTITNNGSVPLDLAQALMRRVGDMRISFSPITPIPPNSSAAITVSFSGGPGNQNFSARFPFESVFTAQGVMCSSNANLQVNASTIGRTGELALTNISGNVGEKATVYVYLRNRNNILIGTEITDTVRTNVTMLYPEDPRKRGFHDYGERVIPVKWSVNSDNENVPIDSLRFLILAGNDSVATLRLMGTPQNRAPNTLITVAPIGPQICRPIVTPFTVPGTPASAFCLLGLPYRTGNSFITTSLGTVSITNIIPQPVTAEMTLEFWSREATLYVLRITDALGQEIMSRQIQSNAGYNTAIVNETIGQKSGVYFIYLRNSRELAARRFMITR